MYEITKHNGRYIVYRVVGNRHLRLGSYESEIDAQVRIEQSIDLMSKK